MDYTWSLKEIYESFECDEYKHDLEEITKLATSVTEYTNIQFTSYENATNKIEEFLRLMQKSNMIMLKLGDFAFLSASTNLQDSLATSNYARLEKISSDFTRPMVAFQKYIQNYKDLQASINKSALLKEHEFYLKEIIAKTKYLLSDKEEILLSQMRLTGSNAWSQLQLMVASKAMVEIEENGEKLTIPVAALSRLPATEDNEVKKKRFEAECRAYDKYADISTYCINNIKGEVITIANQRGYEGPLDMTLQECRMDKETLDALIGSIEEYLPKLRRYYKIKAKLMNYPNGLPYYETLKQVGKSNKKYTRQEAKDIVLKAFKGFSEELYEFVKNIFEHRWIDFDPKVGKRNDGLCLCIYPIKEFRVLLNFNGSIQDANVLAHELGHCFHYKQLLSESVLNISYPLPLAETASTFCEEVFRNGLLKEINDEEKLSFLNLSLIGTIYPTLDVLSRYYFETEFFERRKDHELSTEEIKQVMLDAQKKSYGDGLDNNLLNPYMWLNKVHYYNSDRNFYNFPYAFGLLFALGLYSIYEKKGKAFLADYNSLLKSTGKMNLADICRLVGIDIRSKEFWRMSLDKIVAKIDEFERLANK